MMSRLIGCQGHVLNWFSFHGFSHPQVKVYCGSLVIVNQGSPLNPSQNQVIFILDVLRIREYLGDTFIPIEQVNLIMPGARGI
jgi:hypothetical protein